jgi:hypothetical protein
MYGQKSISQSLLDAVNSVTHAEVEEGFKELMQDVKDRAGPQPNGGAGIKQGTRYGGGRQKDDEREKETERLEKKKEVKKESFRDFKDRLIESLKGNQKKIDKNHNNKIDAQDFKILRAQKEEVELDEAWSEELTPSKHGSISVNSKVISPKEGFHKGEHVGMDTLIHKGNVQHKDNSKPTKFEVHNHVNRGLTFHTHHSDEEKQAIKQHLVKNKYAGKGTDIHEEVELDEAGEIKTPSKGLTVDTLAGPKKAPKGFEKDNEHTSAKVPLKTEAYTSKELKMAGGIAKDKRYVGGNMTGASNVMDKIKAGLSQTKQAQKALRQANEESEGHEDEKEDKALMKKMIKKSALKTEGKRPESDTVPFVTDASQSPKERLRAALGKVKKEMSNGY